ncbi:MAG: long-chain-fatty-acid--CoA ligase [Peptococcaceae bacterium]|nr:long-chain-fatty-acid--CoA ligase [Peptococcaceae bacterium]
MDLGGVLALNSRRHPEKEALVYEGKRYSYRQFNAEANRMAHVLLEMGLKKGDKVALMMQNSDRFCIAFFAIMKAGGVAVPMNYRLAPPEAQYVLDHSESVMMIFDPEYCPLVQEIRGNLPGVRHCIQAEGEAPEGGILEWDGVVEGKPDTDPPVKVDEWDDCEILYTSGTTGRPKGALFDHHRIIHVGFNACVFMGINPKTRMLHVAPLFHSAELNLFLVSGTYVGATQVIHRTFVPQKVLQTLQDEKISFFFGVPTMYNFMLQVPDLDRYDLSSVKKWGYGAAPMAPELVRQAMEKFKNDQFFNLCGLTEGGPGGILLEPEDQLRKPGAGGKAIVNTEARVVDNNGNDVKPGQVGEFVIRGETIMKCYYRNPGATAETIKDGWLHTGDLAVIDDEGYITLVDRKKDMIITGGENVYSTEVEQVLYEYPGVLEAAVIGTPNPVWGETVTAIICPKPGVTLSAEDIRSFCMKKLADYKVPRIFRFTDLLPRNASGKVLKIKLREEFGKDS